MADLRERGYLVFEGFLGADELAAAQEAIWLHYPRPEEYFAGPAAHAWLATSQWGGLITGPWRSWDLNRLAFHPDLLDLAERSARFTLLANYDVWGPRWTGRVAWAAHSLSADWGELIERATPRERSVFGWPAPGDPYWDEQTLADTQTHYPRADLTPYR
ncbi:MAG: hypothetical protein ACRDNF_08645 [Streptosporangiaceae bacterium]